MYISYVIVSMLSPSMVDCGFESGSGQTKDYKVGITASLLSTQHY